MEERNQQHIQPLLQPTTNSSAVYNSSFTSTTDGDHQASSVKVQDDNHINNLKLISSNSSVFLRLLFIFFIGVISIWANYEASKGFNITIVNEANDTPSGKRFALFYVSNDKISRLVINASKFVEDFLYPNESYPKKQVSHVIIRLASQNLTDKVLVDSPNDHEFVLHISRSVMEENNFGHAMFLAVQHGMAHIWLWDGQGKAPQSLVNGMAKYITTLALSNKMSCTKGDCDHQQQHQQGFIRELNKAMKDGWRDQMYLDDDALLIQSPNAIREIIV